MTDSIKERINAIVTAEDDDTLREHLCPFFRIGGHTDCITCHKDSATLEGCKEYYLERITKFPMDLWCPDFDKTLIKARDTKKKMSSIIGIGISCNNCYMYDKCPEYADGYECGIEWEGNRPNTPKEFLDFLINLQYERTTRASVFERVDGGVPDAGLSGEMDRLAGYVQTKAELDRERFSVNIEASGGAATSAGGGILAKLFGKTEEPKAIEASSESRRDVIDITPVEVVPEKEKIPRRRRTDED